MKVFISWSGSNSRDLAEFLKKWLRMVIQSLDPWVSSQDIRKGKRWIHDVSHQLEESKVGIICLTQDNIASPWLLFEAGALAKSMNESYVIPYLFGIDPIDIGGPLSQFQLAIATKEDTYKTIKTINSLLEENSLDETLLNTTFEKFWPELDRFLNDLGKRQDLPPKKIRADREILNEIYDMVKGLSATKIKTLGIEHSERFDDYISAAVNAYSKIYGEHIRMNDSLFNYLTKRLLDAYSYRPYRMDVKKDVQLKLIENEEEIIEWNESTEYKLHHISYPLNKKADYYVVDANMSSYAPRMDLTSWAKNFSLIIETDSESLLNEKSTPIFQQNERDEGFYVWKSGDWIYARYRSSIILEKEFTLVRIFEKSLNSIKDQTYSLNLATPVYRHSINFELPPDFVFIRNYNISPLILQNGLPASAKKNLVEKDTITIEQQSDNHLHINIDDWILPGILMQLNWLNIPSET